MIAGGKKGASTCDHLLILRAIIDISIHQKRTTFLTFYDVSKAYDHIDNEDLLVVMWEKGLRGKTWRILRNLCIDLTASIKTRFGHTRDIQMEIGGKQGSRLTGRMFAKLMDLLEDDFKVANEGFKLTATPSPKSTTIASATAAQQKPIASIETNPETLCIATLLWVDDVVTCAEGVESQMNTLNKVNNFAEKHKLTWGKEKCNVMRVGKHQGEKKEWDLGEMKIDETTKYKYLGDTITHDGKNTENLKSRKVKLQATTIHINTIATSEILNKIETSVLLELHEKISIPILLSNSESWCLNKGDQSELETIEIQTLKSLFDLPVHTPTAAVIYSFGTLYTKIRVDQKQIMYLHKVLNRNDNHWTKKTLVILNNMKIGWSENIRKILESYELPTDYGTIKNISRNEWKRTVTTAIEKMNKERLKSDCHKQENGVTKVKTKTATVLERITNQEYTRKPQAELLQTTKHENKTLIISRYGMLECGRNYGGTIKKICEKCNVIDDENHRLNNCIKWRKTNLYDESDKIDFNLIYSNNIDELRSIILKIEKIWNTGNAHGTMRTD